jgi:LacI family transcriptional regulator
VKKTPITMRDVARRANVGVSTVSKVLNDYRDVADGTRERVLRAVDELQFRPNRAARSFRTGKTQTISVFTPMIGTEFYDRLITAIDRDLAAHDYDAALFPLLNAQRLERYRSPDALPYRADGIILASLNPDWLFPEARLPVPQPAVLVDAYHADYDTVTLDNAGGAYLATQHLLERAAPTFVVMIERFDAGPFSSGVFIERLKGFRRALEEHGQPASDDRVVTVEFSDAGGREALRSILATTRPPVNVFASCDLLGRGILDEARDAGLKAGHDVRVVGFDDQPWTDRYGLSTIHQPVEWMGTLATELLFERLDDPTRPIVHRELEGRLVVRSSSIGGDER